VSPQAARKGFLYVLFLAGIICWLPSAHLAMDPPGVVWEFDTDG